MSTTIDDILAEVDKLDAEATPGPWEIDREEAWDDDADDIHESLTYPATIGPIETWEHINGGKGTDDSVRIVEADAAFIARARTLLPLLAAELRKLQSAKAAEVYAALVREMIDRLTRDAAAFRQTAHVSVSDAKIRADACKTHSEALAKLLTMARALAEDGHHDRAIALLRGDMPAPKETP